MVICSIRMKFSVFGNMYDCQPLEPRFATAFGKVIEHLRMWFKVLCVHPIYPLFPSQLISLFTYSCKRSNKGKIKIQKTVGDGTLYTRKHLLPMHQLISHHTSGGPMGGKLEFASPGATSEILASDFSFEQLAQVKKGHQIQK